MPVIRPSGVNCDFIVDTEWRTRSGYALVFAMDGNLVLLAPTRQLLWESHTSGKFGRMLSMQTDGNLVIYDTSRTRAVWSTSTTGNPGACLSVQEDGNVVIYSSSGMPVWATDTACEMVDGPQHGLDLHADPTATVIPFRPVT